MRGSKDLRPFCHVMRLHLWSRLTRAHAAYWKQYVDPLCHISVRSVWTFRKRGLNTSLPRCVHPVPIKPVFYGSPTMSRLDAGFTLRCFQRLSLRAWLPSIALSDNWYTSGSKALFLSY